MLIDPYKHPTTLLPITAVSQNGNAFGFTATVANVADDTRDGANNGMATASGAAWIMVDLGQTRTVVAVNFTGADLGPGWGEMGSFLHSGTGAKVQTSPDNVSWTTHYACGTGDASALSGTNKYLGLTKVIGPVEVRYVRINQNDPNYPRCPIGWIKVYGY